MKTAFVSQQGARRLILVFAGWAMDDAPFRHLRRPGYDIAIVWDYRDLCPLTADFVAAYDEVCIIAWSLGVYAASVTTDAIAPKITRRVAVNGTLWPVDEDRGIPEAIFAGTLNGLDERNLLKFYRRVAGSRSQYDIFAATMPQRDIPELADELRVFLELPVHTRIDKDDWDVAIIGAKDAIFPPTNQRNAWAGSIIEEIDAPHLIDLQLVIDRYIVDKSRVEERFARGRSSYDDAATVQSEIARQLWVHTQDNAIDILTKPGVAILEIGCGSGLLSKYLAKKSYCSELELWDICGDAPVKGPGISFRRCDAELAIAELPGESVDIIASASTVQWFNSPRRFLHHYARVLKPGGVAVISSFVSGNMHELVQATGKSLPLPDKEQWRTMVPETCRICVCEEYNYSLRFNQAIEVFRHLKATGVNSLDRSGQGASLKRALSTYPVDADGMCTLSYKPIILVFKKK